MDSTEYTYLPSDTQEWTRPPRPTKTMLQHALEALTNALEVDPHRPNDPIWELSYAQAFALVSIAEDVKAIREVAETRLDDKVQAAADARAVWAVVDGLNQRVDPYFRANGCDDD